MANAANIVKLKRSAVAGKSPLTSDLQLGELALNTYDGRLFFTATQNSGSTYNLVTLTENSLVKGSYSVTLNSDGSVSFPSYKFPYADGNSGQVLITDGAGNLTWQTTGATSSGTVTAVSVVNTNGFSGTVATANTTPAITIQTTVTGLLKGNGTSVSAATSGTDYLAPGSLSITTNSPGVESLSYSNGVFTFTPADLSGYVTSTSLSSTLSSYVTSTSLSSTLSSYVTSTTLSGYHYISLTSLSTGTPNAASGGGAISYSNTTGVFTYTPPDLSSYATQSYVTGQGYITNSVTALTSLTSIGSSGVDTTANGNFIVSGNLTVNGTTETVNSTTVTFADKNIELAKPVSPATASDTSANGGGVTLHGTTDKTLNWVLSTTAWTSSENFDLDTGKTYKINGTDVLGATALGSGVTGSSLTSVGTIISGVWHGSSIDNSYLTNTTIQLNGVTLTLGDTGKTIKASTTNALTIGTGLTGTSFDGSSAVTVAVDTTTIATRTYVTGLNYITLTSLSTGTPNSASGTGAISYSNTTGVFTYTPPDLSSYVTSTSLTSTLSSYVTSTSLTSTLSSYVTSTSLTSTLSSYVTSTSLTSTLSNYVTATTLSGYNYITLTSLSMDTPGAASGSGSVTYSNTTGKFKYTPPDLSSYITASVATLASLTTIGSSGVDTTAAGNLIVSGNLTVNGTTETINSTTTTFADKNIELAKPVSPATASDAGANGGGVTLHGTTDKTLNWVLSTTAWTSSENFDLASGKTYKINGTDVLSSTTLGSGVTSSSLTSVGTLTNLTVTNTITGSVSGNAGTATKLATARKINTVSFDGTADITVTADAGTLTGTTLNSTVVNSSLTSVGTLTNLTVTNTITGSITGNAGTVTNGVYTTGSYANPSWLTSLAYSKLTGAPTNVSSFTNDSGYITTGSLSITTNSPGTESLTYSGGVFTFTPYQLPTASTTVLGGVKVDGTTITIFNGVISSAGGGGTGAYVNTTPNENLTTQQQTNAKDNMGLAKAAYTDIDFWAYSMIM